MKTSPIILSIFTFFIIITVSFICQKRHNIQEPFTPSPVWIWNTPESNRFCCDYRDLDTEGIYATQNEILHGPPMEKTVKKPLMTAPCYATDYWSNSFAVPQGINRRGPDYIEDLINHPLPPPMTLSPPSIETFSVPYDGRTPTQTNGEKPLQSEPFVTTPCFKQSNQTYSLYPQKDQMACGNQGGNIMNQYDQEIFSQITTPDMIQVTNLTTQNANSNLGISIALQDTNQRRNEIDGKTVYQQTLEQPVPYDHAPEATVWNVFDPRDHGYGSSDRTYFDRVTGQPRYYYDDINAVRQPMMIYRSNIDFMTDTLPDKPVNADDFFRQSSHLQREDLQRSITRKYNEERGWQLRKAPMYRNQTNLR